jgi:pectinesterase
MRLRHVAAMLGLAACASRHVETQPVTQRSETRVPSQAPAAIVDARFTGTDGDEVNGVRTWRTIGAAIAGLGEPGRAGVFHGAGRAVVLVRNGRYRERLTIERPRLTLRGESRDSTIVTYDAAAGLPSPEGGRYGTRGSYTMRIVAPDFRAEHLTIENAFDYPANAAKADSDATKLRDTQGVALMLDLGSDRAMFEDVRITGHQDTLFPNAGRSYFHRCELWGSVDFIFGAGRAVFDDCDIVSRDRGSRTNNGYVTAPSTPLSQPAGFVFLRSRLKKERPGMAPASVALGRPWHPFGDPNAVGSAVFIDTWMDDHIGEKGWDRMSSTDSTGARVWYEPESARFFEHRSTGPGAVASPRRRTLTDEEARRYMPAVVLDGWVPRLDTTSR